MNVHLETAIPSVGEFDFFYPPNFVECVHGFAPWFCLSPLQLVNRPLGHTNTVAEIGLTPTKDSAGQADFGCKCSLSALFHLSVTSPISTHPNLPDDKNPRRFPAGGSD
jgi:hypothetical protein